MILYVLQFHSASAQQSQQFCLVATHCATSYGHAASQPRTLLLSVACFPTRATDQGTKGHGMEHQLLARGLPSISNAVGVLCAVCTVQFCPLQFSSPVQPRPRPLLSLWPYPLMQQRTLFLSCSVVVVAALHTVRSLTPLLFQSFHQRGLTSQQVQPPPGTQTRTQARAQRLMQCSGAAGGSGKEPRPWWRGSPQLSLPHVQFPGNSSETRRPEPHPEPQRTRAVP
jgi:hypothetical protein